MTETLTMLNREERINRALDGRSQLWVVNKMNRFLPDDGQMTEVLFSRKKKGRMDFTDKELKVLSQILGQDITN